MANQVTVLQPWMSPDDTVEALEILQATAECMRNTAHFSSIRKELRLKLENQANVIDEFVQRVKRGVIDPAVMLALDDMARSKKTTTIDEIVEALETAVTAHNRKRV